MKSIFILFLLTICAIAQVPATDPFAKPASEPEPRNLMLRLRMFAVPLAKADELMSKAELKSDPASVVVALEKLVAAKKARVVANPLIATLSNYQAYAESAGAGSLRWEVATEMSDASALKVRSGVEFREGGNLQSEVKTKLGQTTFLGTLDLPSKTSAETCLVFFSAK